MRRYANLVYSAAKRRLSNASLAEEVAQTVFSRFAHAPPKLGVDAELAAWLHRTTVHVAIDVWRSETRRRIREQSAVMMQSASAEPDRLWDEVAPMLDEALDGLADADRQVLLFRFFDRKAMREIGEAFGITEDAAKMRVSRAVERLRGRLALRGVTCGTAALGGLLATHSLEAAPDGLVAGLSAIKVPARNSASGALGLFSSLLLISKVKLAGGLPEPLEATFSLAKGNLFHGRILDETGNPLVKAVVRTDADNQGFVKFEWSTTTDAEGRFAWTSAPAEPTLFWFEAPGYQVQRDILLTADGTEHEIVLKR